MTDRPVYVYKLVVSYPPGSDEPGWVPFCWNELLAGVKDRRQRQALRRRGFRWPKERLFLSHSGAWGRAGLLSWCGATVEVRRSGEVTWWEDTDAADWWPELTEEPVLMTSAQTGEFAIDMYARYFGEEAK
jgi:hypothetical protein